MALMLNEMREKLDNILLIAGSGQNVGKTSLACQVIQNVKEQKSTGVKITPHFHTPSQGLKELASEKNWKLFEETSAETNKDSSLFLQNGAVKSFFIQTQPEALPGAFRELKKWLPKNQPVVVESATLIEIVDPGLFVVILPDGKCQKKEMEKILHLANLIVISDGKRFFPSSEKIIFNNKWLLS
jgi:hypothetical protein